MRMVHVEEHEELLEVEDPRLQTEYQVSHGGVW